jgi:hypothetical protein
MQSMHWSVTISMFLPVEHPVPRSSIPLLFAFVSFLGSDAYSRRSTMAMLQLSLALLLAALVLVPSASAYARYLKPKKGECQASVCIASCTCGGAPRELRSPHFPDPHPPSDWRLVHGHQDCGQLGCHDRQPLQAHSQRVLPVHPRYASSSSANNQRSHLTRTATFDHCQCQPRTRSVFQCQCWFPHIWGLWYLRLSSEPSV